MSVHLAEVAIEESVTPADLLGERPSFGMVALTVDTVTADGQTVVPDPLLIDPTHANVVGHKTGGIRKKWAKVATVIVSPS
jgi:hypothetical protein